jgi:hypothetical protein
MLLDLECNAERTILKEFEQGILCPRVTPEQMDGFCEHRLADEERGFKFFDALGNPAVVSFRSVEKGDERARINDSGHRGRGL